MVRQLTDSTAAALMLEHQVCLAQHARLGIGWRYEKPNERVNRQVGDVIAHIDDFRRVQAALSNQGLQQLIFLPYALENF